MTKKELADKLNGRAYGDTFKDVLEEARESGLVIVTGGSDDLMEFQGAIEDEGGCFDGMNSDGIPASWTYKTDIPCERFNIWEDGELYCVGLVFSIEDLK